MKQHTYKKRCSNLKTLAAVSAQKTFLQCAEPKSICLSANPHGCTHTLHIHFPKPSTPPPRARELNINLRNKYCFLLSNTGNYPPVLNNTFVISFVAGATCDLLICNLPLHK